jgi:myeloid zinc finger protein 1
MKLPILKKNSTRLNLFFFVQKGKRWKINGDFPSISTDVSPHLIFKNGTLWPQDIPFPDELKDEQGNDASQGGSKSRKSRKGIGIIYPTYFKDENGVNHSVIGNNLGSLYSKSGQKILPDLIQHGRSAGMPLYVRCPICQKEFKQKSTLLQHGCIHIESRKYP